MSPPNLYACPTCGATLSLEQLRGTDCPFCKTVFPHHARATEQAALVNQVMANQMAQINPWTGQPNYPGTPPQVQGQYGVTPPNPYAQNPYGQNPYGYGVGQHVNQAVRRSMIGVFIGVAVSILFTVGIVVFIFAMR